MHGSGNGAVDGLEDKQIHFLPLLHSVELASSDISYVKQVIQRGGVSFCVEMPYLCADISLYGNNAIEVTNARFEELRNALDSMSNRSISLFVNDIFMNGENRGEPYASLKLARFAKRNGAKVEFIDASYMYAALAVEASVQLVIDAENRFYEKPSGRNALEMFALAAFDVALSRLHDKARNAYMKNRIEEALRHSDSAVVLAGASHIPFLAQHFAASRVRIVNGMLSSVGEIVSRLSEMVLNSFGEDAIYGMMERFHRMARGIGKSERLSELAPMDFNDLILAFRDDAESRRLISAAVRKAGGEMIANARREIVAGPRLLEGLSKLLLVESGFLEYGRMYASAGDRVRLVSQFTNHAVGLPAIRDNSPDAMRGFLEGYRDARKEAGGDFGERMLKLYASSFGCRTSAELKNALREQPRRKLKAA